MNKTLTSLVTVLTLACSAPVHNQPIIPSPIPQHTSTPSFSKEDCWDNFAWQSYSLDLYEAATKFKITASEQCYQYATQRASVEKLTLLRLSVMEKYYTLILSLDMNGPSQDHDYYCRKYKENIRQHKPQLLEEVFQIYQEAYQKMGENFPWIIFDIDYTDEKKKFSQTLQAIRQSIFRPYCDTGELEHDLKEMR